VARDLGLADEAEHNIVDKLGLDAASMGLRVRVDGRDDSSDGSSDEKELQLAGKTRKFQKSSGNDKTREMANIRNEMSRLTDSVTWLTSQLRLDECASRLRNIEKLMENIPARLDRLEARVSRIDETLNGPRNGAPLLQKASDMPS